MPTPAQRKHQIPARIKIAAVALLSSIVTLACAATRQRPTPGVLCYQVIAVTDTPTPFVTCYEAVIPSETPTPFVSPLPTPTATPEARHLLLERLLAEGRLPENVIQEL
jgi:hypothetical protein